VLRRFEIGDDLMETGNPEIDAPFDEIPQDFAPEQLSLFSVLSAVATGMQIHAMTPSGIAIPFELGVDEPELPEPSFEDDPFLELDLADIPTEAGWGPSPLCRARPPINSNVVSASQKNG
jgi:hypothetical protein